MQKLSLDVNIGTVPMSKTSTDKIMQSLVSRGYQETIRYSFIAQKYHDFLTPNANKITLLNPISSELSIMRSSLWAGLLQTLESNQRRGHCDARFFEIGLCFDGSMRMHKMHKKISVLLRNFIDNPNPHLTIILIANIVLLSTLLLANLRH